MRPDGGVEAEGATNAREKDEERDRNPTDDNDPIRNLQIWQRLHTRRSLKFRIDQPVGTEEYDQETRFYLLLVLIQILIDS